MQNRAFVVGPSLCDHRCSSVTTFVLLFCGNAEACKCPLYIPDADAGSELLPHACASGAADRGISGGTWSASQCMPETHRPAMFTQ
jgi:hypothetical protein